MKKTHYKKLRNPNYIGSYELMTGGEPVELDVTITKVAQEEVKAEGRSDMCLVAYLKNHKPFILNATNSKQIAKIANSPYIEDWVGVTIRLYVKKIKAFGDWVDALRVKKTDKKEAVKESMNPNHERWNGMVEALKAGKATIGDVLKNFVLSDEDLETLKTITNE